MQRPAAARPVLTALLLVTLAALLTVLSGPSAAAAHADPADAPGASVQGIAPNGEDAAMRAGHAPAHPVPAPTAAVPADPAPAAASRPAGATADVVPGAVQHPATTSRQVRAPPASPAR